MCTIFLGNKKEKEMYDLRLIVEFICIFETSKNQERLPIVKEMKKQLEMMKVGVNFERSRIVRSITLNFMKH